MDEKKPEEMPEEVNPVTGPERMEPVPEPKTYSILLACPNCGRNHSVETPVGVMFPEGKNYVCPTCGFKEYAGYKPCHHCGSGHEYRLMKFSVVRRGYITATELGAIR